jgi:hypothetical protein
MRKAEFELEWNWEEETFNETTEEYETFKRTSLLKVTVTFFAEVSVSYSGWGEPESLEVDLTVLEGAELDASEYRRVEEFAFENWEEF